MSRSLDLMGRVHGQLVHSRRVRVLAAHIADALGDAKSLVDVGCGDGQILEAVTCARPHLAVTGLEVLLREGARVPIQAFDGRTLPLADQSVDAVLFVDVLHHAEDIEQLLAEARRVARRRILIKDHRMARPDAKPILRIMDWVGNRAHGVALTYNYWPEPRWRAAWQRLDLECRQFTTKLGLYPGPTRWIFESGLHFLAVLEPRSR